jgi:hypothetical protein
MMTAFDLDNFEAVVRASAQKPEMSARRDLEPGNRGSVRHIRLIRDRIMNAGGQLLLEY